MNSLSKSFGWSFVSELSVKFVTPLTNMILARLLTPSDFGVVAICNMLISLVDLLSDAGFSKYIIQFEFNSDNQRKKYNDVAFWTNIAFSFSMVVFIFIFRKQIAELLGDSEYATVISIASIQLIITSFSSIYISNFRREFKFNKLFVSRIFTILTPLVITIPLAIYFKSYWSLIIGNITGSLVNSIVLSRMSKWQPSLYYNFSVLKNMFSYSAWSICEALANWLIFWVDTFIVGHYFSDYELGIYKNSSNMVMSIVGMIASAVNPVIFSLLSRLKLQYDKFNDAFYTIHGLSIYILIPMGMGIYMFQDTITLILLGKNWASAHFIIGMWGLMYALNVIFYSFPAEMYKAKGIPNVLFVSQLCFLVLMLPACIIGANLGFVKFVYIRCSLILWQILLAVLFMKKYFNIKLTIYIKSFIKPILCTLIMFIFHKCLFYGTDVLFTNFIAILLCLIVYIISILFTSKNEIKLLLMKLKNDYL